MPYTGPVPPTPTATSTQAQWDNWWAYQRQVTADADLDERKLYREALAASTAAAQASAAASQANAAGQAELAKAMRENIAGFQQATAALVAGLDKPQQWAPRPAPTRNELAIQFFAAMPDITGFTDTQMADVAFKKADAFLARMNRA